MIGLTHIESALIRSELLNMENVRVIQDQEDMTVLIPIESALIRCALLNLDNARYVQMVGKKVIRHIIITGL